AAVSGCAVAPDRTEPVGAAFRRSQRGDARDADRVRSGVDRSRGRRSVVALLRRAGAQRGRSSRRTASPVQKRGVEVTVFRDLAALGLAALPCSLAIASQTQAPTYSAKVEAVRVDALVTDRGQPVLGLKPADFEILDNGVPQDVDLVSYEQIPLN